MSGPGIWRGLVTFFVAVVALHAAAAASFTRFDEWQAQNFSAGELANSELAGPRASPANDGFSNLFKYAVDLSARTPVPASRLPEMRVTNEGWVLDYSRRRHARDLFFEVEVSLDLARWNAGFETAEEVGATPDGPTERVSVWLKNAGVAPANFARVRISYLPAPAVATRVWIGWNFSVPNSFVPQPPTTIDASATSDGLRLGPGVTYASSARVWGATGWGRSSADWLTSPEVAIANGKYIEFTVTPAEGRAVALLTLRYKLRRIQNAPTDFLWQYRVGDGAFVTIGAPQHFAGLETTGVQQPDVDLSSIAALKALREPVTFRFVAWNGNSQVAFGRDTGDGLAILVRDDTVADVLADGEGDFDPWNQSRWAAWYRDGKLARSFSIDCSLRFAERAEPWLPDATELPANAALFRITRPGVVIDGNGVEIDLRLPPYRNRQFAQLLAAGSSEASVTAGLNQGFYFDVPATDDIPTNALRNLTLKGFVQGVRTSRNHAHPLVISRVTFTRNNTGLYLSGTGTLATECDFLENSGTANYSGNDSHANRFVRNRFRDNNYVQTPSYADLVFDTSYGNEVSENQFLPSLLPQGQFRVALSLYRNMGEDGALRENFPRFNVVRGNTVDGYSVGFNLGARQGRAEHGHDIAGEGRDYVARNLLAENSVRNTAIGVKVNTSGNTIEANTFTNVPLPIVLHAVTYSLTETTINDQAGVTVSLWTETGQYSAYASWFAHQEPLMNAIPAAQKLIHVRSERGPPTFSSPGAARLVLAPGLASDDSLRGTISSGGTPRALAVGDFYDNQDGDELAVVWEEPISRVGSLSYYSIIFYDRDGIEINRAGRGVTKWVGLAAGRLTGGRGEQLAAFTEQTVNGAYPLFIFRRGYREPTQVLLTGNTHRIRAVAVGNFMPDDDLDEVAVIFETGPTAVQFLKPTDPSWTVTVPSSVRLKSIAGVRLGDSGAAAVAAIGETADAESVTYPIYFFSADGTAIASAALDAAHAWATIGAGDFVPARPGDEVVVCGMEPTNGGFALECFAPGEHAPRRTVLMPSLAAPPRTLAAGVITGRAMNSVYERIDGFAPEELSAKLAAWGESFVVLPASSSSGAPPALWLNESPSEPARKYFCITPLVR